MYTCISAFLQCAWFGNKDNAYSLFTAGFQIKEKNKIYHTKCCYFVINNMLYLKILVSDYQKKHILYQQELYFFVNGEKLMHCTCMSILCSSFNVCWK